MAKPSSPTRRRYERLAPFYDFLEAPMERMALDRWRRRLLHNVKGPLVLEPGVGTGKNLRYYRKGIDVVGIDISAAMVRRARDKPSAASVKLAVMDVESLAFPDATFDSAIASFLFCSVDDPVAGLRELRRVVKPEGEIILLEHVRPGTPLLGRLFDLLNPITRHVMGPDINRNTVDNVIRAGLGIEHEEDLFRDIVKLLACRTS